MTRRIIDVPKNYPGTCMTRRLDKRLRDPNSPELKRRNAGPTGGADDVNQVWNVGEAVEAVKELRQWYEFASPDVTVRH